MVNISFIVEGKVEKIFIDNLNNTGWLNSKNIKQVGPVIDAKGGGNLNSNNLVFFIEQSKIFNPDKIIILSDLENEPCYTKAKERLGNCNIGIIVIAKKAIEAWFLADSELVETLTNGKEKNFEYPEETNLMPYDTFKNLLLKHTSRGSGSKVAFAKKVLKNGFSIDRASEHNNCKSAKYFINKLSMND